MATVTLSAQSVTLDLDDPRCDTCGRDATFTLVTEQPGPERGCYCDAHALDAVRDAMLSDSFVPACLHPVDLDLYRPWQVAA